jgi:hypothetical protein
MNKVQKVKKKKSLLKSFLVIKMKSQKIAHVVSCYIGKFTRRGVKPQIPASRLKKKDKIMS